MKKYYKRIALGDNKVLLHRYLWECANGPIPKGYDIHHINEDIWDNRLENLECLPHSIHSKVSNIGRKQNRKSPTNNVIPGRQSEAQIKAWDEEERKQKASENNSGENNPFYGQHQSEEAKAKISATHKGKIVSEETRQKLSKVNKGRKFGPQTPEMIQKRVEAYKASCARRYQKALETSTIN